MKCRYCNTAIPEDMVRCPRCGHEVHIVPDYNPLEDMITAHLRGSMTEEEYEMIESSEIGGQHYKENRFSQGNSRNSSSGRGEYRNRSASTANARGANGARSNLHSGGKNERSSGNSQDRYSQEKNRSKDALSPEERERRKKAAAKRMAIKRKKRRRLITTMVVVFLLIVVGAVVAYLNSYTGVVNKGYKALNSGDYTEATSCFKRAIKKNSTKAKAYSGLAQVYTAQGDAEEAEKVFTDAIDGQPSNANLYEACITYYIDTDNQMSIPSLLEDADESVTTKLSQYVVKEPDFSLDDSETFDDVQEVSLTAENDTSIYYSTDGKDPSTKSTEYTEAIQLSEGTTKVKAIAVNADGIPSATVTKKYKVELPVEDAPAVSPSTGQYSTAKVISIQVPEGYTAYYTLDGTDPTSASDQYSDPVDMPEGETIFKAILINKKGQSSGITTRHYTLETE